MLSKTNRNILVLIGVVNLIFCIAFIVKNVNSDKEPISIPSVKSDIPFIPEDENLNGKKEQKITEDVNPAILENTTVSEIKQKLESNTNEGIEEKAPLSMPSLVDVVKNEKILNCNEFIKDETITVKDKFFKKQEC